MIAATLSVILDYAAPAACPRREQFWQSVVQAAPNLALAAEEEQGRAYRVAIQPSALGFQGALIERGRPEPRRLEAADCAELAGALALMLVLSVEQEPPSM